MNYLKYFSVTGAVILVDQAVKLLVHYYMDYGLAGEIKVLGNLFKLHYTLNPGMAFGLEIGAANGKLMLTLFRLVAVAGIAWYLADLIKKNSHRGYIVCIALILGGAIGNLIDSIFYGVLLDNAPADASTPWFHGQVIDMFYVDLWEGVLPDWLPLAGGQYYSFWPIFNVADAAIFCGIAAIIIWQKRFLETKPEPATA